MTINWQEIMREQRVADAAPQMLDALRSVEHELFTAMRLLRDHNGSELLSCVQTAYDAARAAIAKATGAEGR